ncbi:MAG: patatin-like phospholipase family protein [Thermodesulfobacteriota bacterium]
MPISRFRFSLLTFFIILLLPAILLARPKVGLVLSGGGARGGAHLGVIQILEKNQIPIDGIVGTSMGALVGGLYASGMTSSELYDLLTQTNWDRYISTSYDRDLVPIRRKFLERDFPGSLALGVDSHGKVDIRKGLFRRQLITQFIKNKTLPVATVRDFDRLAIPFRAVATNLQDGETVIFRDGSLATAIYSSISIPGAFEPLIIEGKTLVDGGVSDNLPLGVMRDEMAMDIIIAVDISTPFAQDARFDSMLAVVGQLSNILMRKNAEDVILTLRDNEILITPNLEGYTPLDAKRWQEIIKIGAESTKVHVPARLAELALDKKGYAVYLGEHRTPPIFRAPQIVKVDLANGSYLADEIIMSYLNHHVGRPLDVARLDRDILEIYGLGIFSDVTYELLPAGDGQSTLLKVETVPGGDSNGLIEVAIGFQDDFTGSSDYLARAEYLMLGLNRYGGEWRSRLAIGLEKLLFSEWYQPLDVDQRFYLRPDIFYRNRKVYITPAIIAEQAIGADLDDSLPVMAEEYGATMGLGFNIKRSMQFEMGVRAKEVQPALDLIVRDAASGASTFVSRSSRQKSLLFYGELLADSMDHPFFPSKGYLGEMRWTRQMPEWGSDMDFSQGYLRLQGTWSHRRHTLISRLKGGITYDTVNFAQSNDLTTFFTLGGLFNLSGLPPNAVSGDHLLFGGLSYRYRLSEHGFFGALEMPLYSGCSVEAGETWYEEYGQSFRSDDLIYAGSVYLAADTVLGPFFLGLGLADGRYHSLYFSLGGLF